ncbi:MAG TPA: TlpA disulfide reductase family protein [Candidatus Baltobacteraceae bacterium]|nr:TlpA disulfide reductase family protein [Candidatus Baltobacteraceae bacterium]
MVKTAVALVLTAALGGCAAHSGAARPGRVGGPVPKWSLQSTTGAHLTDASFAGKPVYMNFFATWCPPCNEEAPDVNAMQKKYAAQGLQVVGVDEAESMEKARSFMKAHRLDFPAVADDGTLEDAFLVNGLPVHVFIARNGTIQMIHAGEMSREQIEAAVRSVL